MKSVIYTLGLMSLVMASAITTIKANAQTKVDVPFSFNIGSVSYPAGLYFIERVHLRLFVALENNDGREIKSWGVYPGEPSPTDTKIGLIVDEVESRHILRAVQYRTLITPRLDGGKLSSRQAKLRSRE